MSTRVIPIEEVIKRLPKNHVPSNRDMKRAIGILESQGQIVPIVLDELHIDPISVHLIYAAVELGWPTMLVTDTDITSG